MEEPLLLPHATTTTTTTTTTIATSTSTILTRLATVLIVATLSLWASHEASKGFDIAVFNSAAGTPAGRRFDLMFVSNGRAACTLLDATGFIERALFPDELYCRKLINRIVINMASLNLTHAVSVTSTGDPSSPGDFTIHLSPALMFEADASAAVTAALHRGMARAWLWDGRGTAPRALTDAMVEYLALLSGFPPLSQPVESNPLGPDESCLAERDPLLLARFLRYCEERCPGFVARLNHALREDWSAHAVDGALGAPAWRMCAAYRLSARQPAGSTSDAELRQVM